MPPEFILIEYACVTGAFAFALMSVWRAETLRRELSNAHWRLDRLQDDNARLRDELAKERHNIDPFEYDEHYDEDDEDEPAKAGVDSAERPVA